MFNIFKRKKSDLSFLNSEPTSIEVWIVEWYPPGEYYLDEYKPYQKQKIFYLEDDAKDFTKNLKLALEFIGDKCTEINCYKKTK
jgi:hypothetical protein